MAHLISVLVRIGINGTYTYQIKKSCQPHVCCVYDFHEIGYFLHKYDNVIQSNSNSIFYTVTNIVQFPLKKKHASVPFCAELRAWHMAYMLGAWS